MNILSPWWALILIAHSSFNKTRGCLFTALYLLPITIKAFFPGDKNQEFSKVKENKLMSTVLIILTVSAVLIGIFSNYIISAVQGFLF